MERNRWDTAIRCLEIAVHPNTDNQEVIAAINGFRRTVNGMPLRQLVQRPGGSVPGNAVADELRRVVRENQALRQKIQAIEHDRATTLTRLHDAERRVDAIGGELIAAERRADAAEQRLAEFRGAYGRISGSLSHENFDLRRALQEARRNLAQPIHEPVPPFQAVLDAALQGPDHAPANPSATLPGSPWTA
jgi:hypothetical protein